jgi:hypothetical protein
MEEIPGKDTEHTPAESNGEQEKPKSKGRREFIKNLSLIGAGAVTGAAALYSGHVFEAKKEKSGQSHVLLTQDNRLVEVDSLEMKYLEKSPGR